MDEQEKMNKVVETLTEHFMDDGEHGAEATFNRFAADHAKFFEEGFNEAGAE